MKTIKQAKQLISLKALFALTVVCMSSLAFAEKQQVDKTIDASPTGNVEIEHIAGKAQIIGWDKDQVSVKGELGERTEKFIFERRGNTVLIVVDVKKNGKWNGWNNWGDEANDNLMIYVPFKSRLEYTTTNSDVELENIHGGVSAEVVNGDMRAEDISGRVRLESVNGDINAREVKGELTIETVNGDIKANHLKASELSLGTVNGDIKVNSDSPEVIAETVNGDIELELQKIDELELQTVNGSIEAKLALNDNADVRASSVGGLIELSFKGPVSARFDIEAHAGGSIKNKITEQKMSRAKYGPRRWLEFETADASSKVEVSTVHGKVRLETH